MTKEKIMIYPFSDEAEFYIHHSTLLYVGEIETLVSFRGAGYNTRKYQIENKSISVSENFEKEMEKCTALLPVFTNEKGLIKEDEELASLMPNTNKMILENIKVAIEKKRKIIIVENNSKEVEHLLEIVPKELQINVKGKKIDNFKEDVGKMHRIKTPIVFVGSAFEGLNKMDLLLSLYNGLTDRGYKVTAIGTKKGSELFGVFSYPWREYKELSDSERIIHLNNYVKTLEHEYKPDVIIMGVPGGTAPFSMKAPLDFGTELFRMIKATTPDYVIMSIPYAQYSDVDLMRWSMYYKRNFGLKVDAYNIINKSILQQLTETYNNPHYLSLDDDLVKKIIDKTFSIPTFCNSSFQSMEKLIENIIDKFQYNKSISYI